MLKKFALVAAAIVLTTTLSGCGVSDVENKGLREDLIARGFKNPVLVKDDVLNGWQTYSVSLGSCQIWLRMADNTWYYDRTSSYGGWSVKSAEDLYQRGRVYGMFADCGYTPKTG